MSSIEKKDLLLYRGIEDIDKIESKLISQHASLWAELETETSRRAFLKLMGASLALAGLASCTKLPAEKIYPFPIAGQDKKDTEGLFFASSALFAGFAKGILVESQQGRPTKIEGNKLHPASFGTSDIFMQAEILRLYDPARSKAVMHQGEISSWDNFKKHINITLPKWQESAGRGMHILSNTNTSPTIKNQLDNFLKKYPQAKYYNYDVINFDSVNEGSKHAFGKTLRPIYHFDKAQVVLSLDADFLGPGVAQQAYARDFVAKRKFNSAKDCKEYNRLYSVDSSISITGSLADSRIALKPSQIFSFAASLAQRLGININIKTPAWLKQYDNQIKICAADLLAHAGKSIVIAGDQQTPALHALCHAINEALKNNKNTIEFIDPPESYKTNQYKYLQELCTELAQNKVETLIILGANPSYATPGHLAFSELITKAKLKIHLGLYHDETAFLCDWHLPESHFLESWGDALAFDGTISLQQPLISPLYDSRTTSEFLSLFLGDKESNSYKLLKQYWTNKFSENNFVEAVHDGLFKNSQSKPIFVQLRKDWELNLDNNSPKDSLEISFRSDPTVFDGSYANNAWLQELPKPILQLCWDNAALISPNTAKKLELKDEDKIELNLKDRKVEAPVLIIPGHCDDSVTVYFGYGRTRADIADKLGYNAYELFDGQNYFSSNLIIKKLNKTWPLARTHRHHSMEGRELVRHGSIQDFFKDEKSIINSEAKAKLPSLLENRLNAKHAWAMVIDLNSCIGCNTCTIACQAENNIPVVGKEQVMVSREMHWIRVDRYFAGPVNNPKTFFQPVPCMHCETAPCELVCPTVATNHSKEGLNQMVYNRCVGTRYCSNNCPYKVRRFNFLQYSDMNNQNLRLMYNPEVTVRSRGVMEKCTYCVQRIEKTRIKASIDKREIKDGEITPACAQACPTKAITFGDKNNPDSHVAKLIKSPLNYSLLHELGTLPRTTYLGKLYDENRWKIEGQNA